MRRIGIVASGSTVLEAGVILAEGEERNVKAEDLVLIKNRNGNLIMAVCRGGLGSNENLRTSNYSPGVAYARVGRHPSNAKEFYAFGLSVIGNVSEGSLKENKMLIAPSSEVEAFEEHDNPMAILGSPTSTIGYYKDHPSWRVPINPSFICYHMGVFASTGAGKSLLTRYEIIPFIRAAGYRMLIFDWKGSDYAPFFACRYGVSDIALEDDVVVDYLCSVMDQFGFYQSSMIERNPIRAALETVVYQGNWRNCDDPEKLRCYLKEHVLSEIEKENVDEKTGKLGYWARNYLKKFDKCITKLNADELRNVLGKTTAAEILEVAKQLYQMEQTISMGEDFKGITATRGELR